MLLLSGSFNTADTRTTVSAEVKRQLWFGHPLFSAFKTCYTVCYKVTTPLVILGYF
jgi:hypothetical protein